jgi:peptidoglycan/LPS O-acetylase OafA/YrhL
MLFHFGLSTLVQRVSLGMLPRSDWGLCVDFFFLLSGFVLCHSYRRRSVSLMEFAWRRAMRLLPLYLVGTFLALVFVQEKFDDQVIAANLVMLQAVLLAPSINFPDWSVPFEFYLPLAAVAAAPVAQRMSGSLSMALLTLAIASGCILCVLYESGTNYELLRAAAGLSGGALLYHVWSRRRVVKNSAVSALCGIAGAMLIMAVSGTAPVIALLFYPCAIAAIWFGAGARGLFSLPACQAVGRWSYSIYLLHIPVLAAYQMLTGQTLQGAIITKASLAIFVIALAGVSYRFVELPAMNFGRSTQFRPVRAR